MIVKNSNFSPERAADRNEHASYSQSYQNPTMVYQEREVRNLTPIFQSITKIGRVYSYRGEVGSRDLKFRFRRG